VKDAKIPTLVHQTWGIQSLFFNFKNPQSLTANRDFRKAVAIALEAHSQEYLSTAIGVPGIIRTYSWVPLKMKGVTKTFLSEYPAKKPSSKLADAKKFMESAKKSMGGTLPRITFLTTDSPGSVRQAAFLQQIFKNDLGVEMVLDYQIWKVLLSKSSKGEFDMMTFGWVPDYADPLNYFEVFTSTNGNNLGKWNSPAFDRAIDLAVKAKDRKSHMDALGQAQALLLDEQVIVPAYENADIWVKNPKIKGVLRRVFGPDPDFTRAVIE
jgi:oligopeptide transport system substrate-binding protein